MKQVLYIFFWLILCLVFIQNIEAQNNETSPIDRTQFDSEILNSTKIALGFPSVQTVIDSVIKRSAMMNFRKNNIKIKESELSSERRGWTQNLGAQVDAKYGNINNFLTNDNSTSGNSTTLSTTQQFTYSGGFYLKFPLFDGINRKNQIKQAKSEVEAAKNMVEFENEHIRQTVITLYQDLILKQKLLEIKSRSLGDARVNMQMVEKEFRNGVVPISEYVRISGMTTSTEEAYETAKSEFITAKKILEDMAGFVFGLKHSN